MVNSIPELEPFFGGVNLIPEYLIDDADLESVRVPRHSPDHRLVPVVDHLLIPAALVQHPHYDQAILQNK